MKGSLQLSLLAFTCIIASIPLHQVQSEPQRRQSDNQQPRAARCDPNRCRLPDCFCGGKTIPGGYKPEQIPQFVLLTFDDAVNGINKEFFTKLFKERYNPNGCPIKVLNSNCNNILHKNIFNDLCLLVYALNIFLCFIGNILHITRVDRLLSGPRFVC